MGRCWGVRDIREGGEEEGQKFGWEICLDGLQGGVWGEAWDGV